MSKFWPCCKHHVAHKEGVRNVYMVSGVGYTQDMRPPCLRLGHAVQTCYAQERRVWQVNMASGWTFGLSVCTQVSVRKRGTRKHLQKHGDRVA
jgi:hypothetical protein